jgi:hypothetical protein
VDVAPLGAATQVPIPGQTAPIAMSTAVASMAAIQTATAPVQLVHVFHFIFTSDHVYDRVALDLLHCLAFEYHHIRAGLIWTTFTILNDGHYPSSLMELLPAKHQNCL